MTNTEQNKNDNERQLITTPATEDVAWLLVGSGVVGALVMLVRGHRKFVDWVMPVGLIGAGLAVLLKQRQKHIDEVADNILADLDTLDPVAKAQVLKAIADQELDLKK
ncbi:MAG: hypothetical protein OES12_08270 [Anaerolineae bacterium]|jgi:hypothetical protein|nr:hypothetical protein [Anaerolineae bacterium]